MKGGRREGRGERESGERGLFGRGRETERERMRRGKGGEDEKTGRGVDGKIDGARERLNEGGRQGFEIR